MWRGAEGWRIGGANALCQTRTPLYLRGYAKSSETRSVAILGNVGFHRFLECGLGPMVRVRLLVQCVEKRGSTFAWIVRNGNKFCRWRPSRYSLHALWLGRAQEPWLSPVSCQTVAQQVEANRVLARAEPLVSVVLAGTDYRPLPLPASAAISASLRIVLLTKQTPLAHQEASVGRYGPTVFGFSPESRSASAKQRSPSQKRNGKRVLQQRT